MARGRLLVWEALLVSVAARLSSRYKLHPVNPIVTHPGFIMMLDTAVHVEMKLIYISLNMCYNFYKFPDHNGPQLIDNIISFTNV